MTAERILASFIFFSLAAFIVAQVYVKIENRRYRRSHRILGKDDHYCEHSPCDEVAVTKINGIYVCDWHRMWAMKGGATAR